MREQQPDMGTPESNQTPVQRMKADLDENRSGMCAARQVCDRRPGLSLPGVCTKGRRETALPNTGAGEGRIRCAGCAMRQYRRVCPPTGRETHCAPPRCCVRRAAHEARTQGPDWHAGKASSSIRGKRKRNPPPDPAEGEYPHRKCSRRSYDPRGPVPASSAFRRGAGTVPRCTAHSGRFQARYARALQCTELCPCLEKPSPPDTPTPCKRCGVSKFGSSRCVLRGTFTLA